MSFHDQLKKNRPPSSAKPSDSFASNAANSLMNPNQMRNMQSSAIPSNPPQSLQAAAPMRQRPTSGNSPQQVLLSSDDEIMDDSLVGKWRIIFYFYADIF